MSGIYQADSAPVNSKLCPCKLCIFKCHTGSSADTDMNNLIIPLKLSFEEILIFIRPRHDALRLFFSTPHVFHDIL